MKIFITGVAGFLGSHLADRFLELGHEVSGNDTLIGGYLSNVNPEVKFHQVDCCNFDVMKLLLKDIDIVVHAAATAHEGFSVFSPAFITKNNYQASVSVASAAISAGVKRFIFCSSMARYGAIPTPYHEDSIPKPEDPYGISKLASEDVLKNLCKIHGEMEWNIAIPHNIVGPRQRYDDPYRNVISIMINRHLQNKPSVIYGDGNQVRCFSDIEDCIYCLEKLTLDPDIKYQIVNIGPDSGEVTINELATLVANETGFNHPPVYVQPRPAEVKISHCSSERARRLLGYETKIDLKTSIKRTADWIRERGPVPFDYSLPTEIITDRMPDTWKYKIL